MGNAKEGLTRLASMNTFSRYRKPSASIFPIFTPHNLLFVNTLNQKKNQKKLAVQSEKMPCCCLETSKAKASQCGILFVPPRRSHGPLFSLQMSRPSWRLIWSLMLKQNAIYQSFFPGRLWAACWQWIMSTPCKLIATTLCGERQVCRHPSFYITRFILSQAGVLSFLEGLETKCVHVCVCVCVFMAPAAFLCRVLSGKSICCCGHVGFYLEVGKHSISSEEWFSGPPAGWLLRCLLSALFIWRPTTLETFAGTPPSVPQRYLDLGGGGLSDDILVVR